MKLGSEVFLKNAKKRRDLKGKRLALVCHPASVNEKLEHSFELFHQHLGLASAFGPQHGVLGEKQDNMVESEDFLHPVAKVPVFSLYGRVRRPTPEMMETFDVLLFDLQDLGCRIYTFITTLLYMMEACAVHQKKLIVLDRPNPIGRGVEGFRLEPGWESFVGAAPIPMRHGLTVGELALYYKAHFKLDLELEVVKMQGYKPDQAPGYGWPKDRVWVNPSPNAPNLNMARAYPGTVLLEGTNLSEGRGTTRSLEVIGARDLDVKKVLALVEKLDLKGAASFRSGVILRECYFEPTFHKFQGQICHGIQLHYDSMTYKGLKAKPFRLLALLFKAIRQTHPDFALYREFTYEYVEERLAFDVINGGEKLRQWIENPKATVKALDQALKKDEGTWLKESKKYWLYR